MTYLVAYEIGDERHFVLGSPQWQSGIRACREFRSRQAAEQVRRELANRPDVTAAYVISMGR